MPPIYKHCKFYFQNSATVSHELLHALGVMHEHKRPDRDDFVTIHWSNIPADIASQYYKDEWVDQPTSLPLCSTITGTDFTNCVSGLKTTAFNLAYDPESIMHYPRIAA